MLLSTRDADAGETRPVVVPRDNERRLRYADRENTRRLRVEERGDGHISYVHLRAMGGGDIDAWCPHFYPIFNREGLIIDVRRNNGRNIDLIILEKRRAAARRRSRQEPPIAPSRVG